MLSPELASRRDRQWKKKLDALKRLSGSIGYHGDGSTTGRLI